MGKLLKKIASQYKFSKNGLSFREKLTLALPGPASVIGPIIIHNALIKFYTDIIGIDAKYIGWIYLIYNIWNAINDPLLGIWVDRLKYNEKRGKYVYLLKVTAPLMLISIFGMLFSSPTWSQWGIFFALLGELFVFDTAYTVYSVAYQSYFLIAAPSAEERVDVDIIRTFIGNALGCVTTIIPTLLLVGNGNRALIIPIFSVVIAINALMYFVALRTLKDKGEMYALEKHDEHRPFKEVWVEALNIIKTRAFITYLLFYITARGAMEYYFTPFLYFMDDVVKSSGVIATVADVVPGLVMLALLPLFGNLIKKHGSKTMTMVSLLPAMAGFAGLMFIKQAWQAVICYTFIVLALNVAQRAGVVMNGDLIDEDEMRTGIRKTGMYGGIFSLFATSLTSLQSLIFTNVISKFGYDGSLEVQTEQAVMGIRIGAGLVPLCMIAVGFIPLVLFPIGKKKEKEISEFCTRTHGSGAMKNSQIKKYITSGKRFVDKDGNTVKLHGVNMVCKDRSVNHIGNYTNEDFKFLHDHGMNLVRLGIFWESVEPKPGVFDEEYLDKIEEIVNMAGKNDVCVFLDMHQDLFSAEFEDGAPKWATITGGKEYHKTELWSDAYLIDEAVQTAFDSFWRNAAAEDGYGILDRFSFMWGHIAKRFKDNPYVIGYDFFNEPFPGTSAQPIAMILGDLKEKILTGDITDEVLFDTISKIEPITAAFEENILVHFYEKVGREVRKYDKEAFIALENNYFSNAGIPTHIRPVTYEDGKIIEHQIFAPHGYDIFVDTDMYDNGDTSRVDLIFGAHRAVAEALNIPVIVGEWGCYPNATPGQLEQAKHLKATFESMGAGDTYFEFDLLKNCNIIDIL